jgi:hypothetical protein
MKQEMLFIALSASNVASNILGKQRDHLGLESVNTLVISEITITTNQ